MIKRIKRQLVLLRNTILYHKWNFFAKKNQSKFQTNAKTDFIVSIASYPKRAHLLPAVFEALNKQTLVPQKWILVLSEEEWPNLTLPSYLNKLIKRGLEIVWVKNNTYAVKKFMPVAEKYSNLAIVTLDDDIIYHPSLLRGLVKQAEIEKMAVIGYVGKAILKKDKELHLHYREKDAASITTPSEQVYLIGWGGIYYPPHSLDEKVLNMEAVHKIVPGRGSDFWFWAAAHAKNTKQVCLGIPKDYNLGIPIPQNEMTKPKDQPEGDVVPNRFQMAVDYFGIREKLLRILPDENGAK